MSEGHETYLFADVDEGGFDLDEDGEDRAVFHHIWTLLETGDMWPGDGWELMSDRYPDEPGFRILAAARGAEQSGTSLSVGALERLIGGAPHELARVAQATVVIMTNHTGIGEQHAAIQRLLRAHGVELEVEDAYRIIDAYERSVLTAANERTRGGRPWKAQAAAPVALDYAGWLAQSAGDAQPYSTKGAFAIGQRVEHAKFGLGVVTKVEAGRMSVIFASGSKTLACA
jgi:hypothetical protein